MICGICIGLKLGGSVGVGLFAVLWFCFEIDLLDWLLRWFCLYG